MAWVEIRNPLDRSKILFRYDPERRLVEVVQRRCEPVVVDLTRYEVVVQGGTVSHA